MAGRLKFNQKNWNAMIKEIIDTDGVERMTRVADACNAGISLGAGQKGYMMSVVGDDPLTKHGYRATVITASAKAVIDNARNDTLVHHFHLAA